jgi:hypothetical protein
VGSRAKYTGVVLVPCHNTREGVQSVEGGGGCGMQVPRFPQFAGFLQEGSRMSASLGS